MTDDQFKQLIKELRLISFGGASCDINNANQKGAIEGQTFQMVDMMEYINEKLGRIAEALEKIAKRK